MPLQPIRPTGAAELLSFANALELLRGLKVMGRSWTEMGQELQRQCGVPLDKDQLKVLVRQRQGFPAPHHSPGQERIRVAGRSAWQRAGLEDRRKAGPMFGGTAAATKETLAC